MKITQVASGSVVGSGWVVAVLLFVIISCTAAQDCGILVGSSGAIYNLTALTRPASSPWTAEFEDGSYVFYWNFCTNLTDFPDQQSLLPRPSPTIQLPVPGDWAAYSIGYLPGYKLAEIGVNQIQLNYTNYFELCPGSIARLTIITVTCNISAPGDGVVLLVHNPAECLYIINMQSTHACAYSDCEAGFAADPVSLECVACPAGYSTLGLSNQFMCTPCAAGSFSSGPGSANCAFCKAGTSTKGLTGQVTCSDCHAGTFSLEGYAVCAPCDPGYFTKKPRRSSCDPCSSGSATNQAGQTACTRCSPGTAINKTGSIDCDNCIAGYYANNYGAIACTPCSPGYSTQNQTRQSACAACGAGTFNPNMGASVCLKCEKGTYQLWKGRGSCNDCPAGTIGETEGVVSCSICPPNTYSAIKSSVCTLCPARTHSIAGSKSCTLDEGPIAGFAFGGVVLAGVGAAGWHIFRRRRGYTAV